MTFVKEKFREYLAPINVKLKEEGRIITHQDLLRHLKEHDEEHYREALEQHFEVYKIFIREKNNRSVEKRQNRYL